MVEARRAAKTKEERYDLFSYLLDANEDELDSAAKLSDSKLVGACAGVCVSLSLDSGRLVYRERLPVLGGRI